LGLHCESLNLSEEAERVVELFSALAEEKQINLSVSLPENPLLLRGDQGRIQRILANLLDNAIKYTPEGGRVELRIFQKNKGACLEIQDTGIGIPKADYQRVFERFYRGELGRSRSGNGLGLNLVQAFVSAHGGCLELESPAEGGCLVRVCLPLDPLRKIDEACG
jgi:signal transduction histidine kinase